jgi:hypothetical protein
VNFKNIGRATFESIMLDVATAKGYELKNSFSDKGNHQWTLMGRS